MSRAMDPDRFQMKDLKRRLATAERAIERVKGVQKATRLAIREMATLPLEELQDTVKRLEQLTSEEVERLDSHLVYSVQGEADALARISDMETYLSQRFGYRRSALGGGGSQQG